MNVDVFYEGEAYGGARMPNWPHRHRTLCPGSPHWTCTGTRRNVLRKTLVALVSKNWIDNE